MCVIRAEHDTSVCGGDRSRWVHPTGVPYREEFAAFRQRDSDIQEVDKFAKEGDGLR